MNAEKAPQKLSTSVDPLRWTVVSAVNNEQVLKSCLLSSPDISQAAEVLLQTGHPSAAQAYNAALAKATTDIVVFVHQDVFLPAGWINQVQKSLQWLAHNDPNWAVAGVWGVKRDGSYAGDVYCTGLGARLGGDFLLPIEVRTVDELLFIVRKSSGVRFDEALPGYHMYGTDICLEAQRRGLKCYAISAFCIHNTNGYTMLPWQFWKCYLMLRRKWSRVLPVITPCIEITRFCKPGMRWIAVRSVNLLLNRHKVGKRLADPAKLYRELVATGKVILGAEAK